MERDTLSAIGALLDALSIRWVLIGAVAANRYRKSPRLTQDVDLLLSDTGPGLVPLEDHLRSAGWSVHRADAEGELVRVRHPTLGFADLLVAGTNYQQEAIARARDEVLEGGVRVRVLAAEDVIVHKLIAGRAQDLADIEAILEANVPLDLDYLDRWVEFWEVSERWRTLRGK